MRSQFLEQVEKERDEMVGFLQELVRIPSVTGREGQAQRFMEEKFESLGLETVVFEADIEEVREHPSFFETASYRKFRYATRPNVIGELRGSGGGRSLIFSGHIDVVSPEPVSAWKHDPWGGEIAGDRLYGRGAGDMKGGIASFVYAVHCLQEIGARLKGDVILESTIEEEDGGIGGVLATTLRGYTADAALIPEPSFISEESIGIASAGVMYFRIKILGKAMHTAYAHRGVNAIAKAMKIYEALTSLNEERQRRVRYPPAEVEEDMKGRATTINVGKISGGDWPSTVAGFVEMEGRVGWPPIEDIEQVKREIEEAVYGISREDDWMASHPPKIEWFGWRAEPSEQDVSHPFVSTVSKNVKEITGKDPLYTGGYAGLDTRFFIRHANIPAVTYGPRGYNLHSTDEYVDPNSVVDAAKVIGLTIMDWCGA